jgi:hypothetical protein
MDYNPYARPGMLQMPNSPGKPMPGAAPQPGMGIAPLQQPPQAGSAEAAQIAALLGTYGDTQELESLDQQMAQAEALRMSSPEMRGNGRVQTAANPLEFIGKGIGDYKLMKKQQETDAAKKPIRERIGGNVKKYGELAIKDL